MKLKIVFMIALACYANIATCKEIIGWVENVLLTENNLLVKAKIDSGARHSSLHCDCTAIVNQKGEKWVHLKIANFEGKITELDKKVLRQAKIKRHDGKMQIRDVIKLTITLGSVKKEVEVNLIDRTGLNYQLLIGRSYLKGDFLIDTSKKFIRTPKYNTKLKRF